MLLVVLPAGGSLHAQSAPPAASSFDFLLGAWELAEERLGGEPPTHATGETFVFERAPAGPGLISHWRINRGTETVPDFSNVHYVHAYDRETARWSFYYVGDRAAQFYEGRRTDSGWTFHRPYHEDERTIHRRQAWIPLGADSIRRTIEDSVAGRPWRLVYSALLRRAPGNPPATPQDSTAERAYYDFWEGTWYELRDGRRAQQPSYVITRPVHAGAFEEQWGPTIEGEPPPPRAVRVWEHDARTWRFIWTERAGHTQYWDTRKHGTDWYIYRQFTQNGETFVSRQAWLPQADGSVVRVIERSLDGGKTWFTRYRQVLVRG